VGNKYATSIIVPQKIMLVHVNANQHTLKLPLILATSNYTSPKPQLGTT
jgi:hypothetical protein